MKFLRWYLLFAVLLTLATWCKGQDAKAPAPKPAEEKILPVDAQVKILKLEDTQKDIRIEFDRLREQESQAGQAYNDLKDQIDKLEADEVLKLGMNPSQVTIDDGRAEVPAGTKRSEKTFKVTPKEEPKPAPAPAKPADTPEKKPNS